MSSEGRSTLEGLKRCVLVLRWPAILAAILFLSGKIAFGPVARGALERSLEGSLGSEVTVYKVVPAFFTGSAEATRISLENPEEFAPGEAVLFPSVELNAMVKTLWGGRVELDLILFRDTRVLLDVQPAGVNFFALLNRLRERISARSASLSEKGPREYKIHEVVLEGLEFVIPGDPEFGKADTVVRLPPWRFSLNDRWYRFDESLERLLSKIENALDGRLEKTLKEDPSLGSLPERLLSELESRRSPPSRTEAASAKDLERRPPRTE